RLPCHRGKYLAVERIDLDGEPVTAARQPRRVGQEVLAQREVMQHALEQRLGAGDLLGVREVPQDFGQPQAVRSPLRRVARGEAFVCETRPGLFATLLVDVDLFLPVTDILAGIGLAALGEMRRKKINDLIGKAAQPYRLTYPRQLHIELLAGNNGFEIDG